MLNSHWVIVDILLSTNSCSMGFLLALRAHDVGTGDEAITTPMTFAATANAILHLGATPVFVDVEPETGLIDANAISAAVTSRTRGILPVHLYGQLADMRTPRSIADRHALFLIEMAISLTARRGSQARAKCEVSAPSLSDCEVRIRSSATNTSVRELRSRVARARPKAG
jgi:dTDP-4-amino-4,6-dideoxygalactose transaminase